MRKHPLAALITVVSLCAPMMGLLSLSTPSKAERKPARTHPGKLTDALRERIHGSGANSGETARVIVNLSDGASSQPLLQSLTQSGSRSQSTLTPRPGGRGYAVKQVGRYCKP
jgi:hypothetical protein